MSGEEFFDLFRTRLWLRQQILLLALQYSQKDICRYEMVQMAWMAISWAEEGLTDERYLAIGFFAAERCYNTKYRYHPRRNDSTERHRMVHRRRFFLKRRPKTCVNVI